MKRRSKIPAGLVLCFVLVLAVVAAQADVGLDVERRSHSAIMNFISSHPMNQPDEMYEAEPSTVDPFFPGKLNPLLVQHALNALNSLRFVAGIGSDVTENPEYAEKVQAAALVNAVNGSMSHYPDQPEGMPDDLYQLGYEGASSSILASGNSGSPIKALLNEWIHDGDSRNVDRVGRRRWVLDPRMTETAFGAVGRHTAMYAFGFSWDNYDVPQRVAWPAQMMPYGWMSGNLPWSVSFRDGLSNGATVTIARRSDGKTWNLYEGSGDGYFHIDRGGYGAGDCMIFRPKDIVYTLGDHYDVTITGAEEQTVRYSVELYNFDKAESFVDRCYSVILDRAGESEGVTAWAAALRNRSRTAAEIINSFIMSDEFLQKNPDCGRVVDTLYQAMLGRAADPDDRSICIEALEAGNPVDVIISGLCGSDEFKALCGNYGIEPGSMPGVQSVPPGNPAADTAGIRAFVERCYEIILGRFPDGEGLQGWSDALETRNASAAQVIDGFVRSPEFMGRNPGNDATVDILYRVMLNREPDPEGKAGWTDALSKGFTLQHIINGFCGSDEFANLCNLYGIVPGNVAVSGAVVKREGIAPEGVEEAAPAVIRDYTPEFTDEEKIRAFVEHCYVSVFGREGDAEGIANYTALILEGKKTPKSVAYEFIFSPEFREKLPGNEEFIRILYRLYFHREADAEGLAGWVQMLEGGATQDEIVNGFANSAEFKTIVNEMK